MSKIGYVISISKLLVKKPTSADYKEKKEERNTGGREQNHIKQG